MTYKVGVYAEDKVAGEVLTEAKKALESIAAKYNCRFELSKEETTSNSGSGSTNNFNERLTNATPKNENGVFLSFGGELEL